MSKSIRERFAELQLAHEDVTVDGVGDIRLVQLPGTAWDDWREALQRNGKSECVYFAHIVIMTAVDPQTGDKLFTPDDIPMLSARPLMVLSALGMAALRINGALSKN